MLRKIRIFAAAVFFILITSILLGVSGLINHLFGWTTHLQVLPAILSVNLVAIFILLLLTLLFGRIYCSVICPLGVTQDIISHFASKHKRNRFTYTKPHTILRIIVLAIFVIAILCGFLSLASIIEPYSVYGRIATNLLSPIYLVGNNILAFFAEKMNSYTFAHSDIWIKSFITFGISLISFAAIAILSWRKGRLYCNSICPVGTILGFLSKFSFFRPMIETSKCTGCRKCARNCKASCIDYSTHSIDYSRCVACMDCLNNCNSMAIHYAPFYKQKTFHEAEAPKEPKKVNKPADPSLRSFLALSGTMAATTLIQAQVKKKVDGGLAVIEDKKVPKRHTPITPPGSWSAANLADHCVACQLCITSCPNEVLRPSDDLSRLMQPIMGYDKGYCRPGCTRCSELCPTGAIRPIRKEEKSSIQLGHAVWISKNCIVNTDGVSCGNCSRHCPNGAIQMTPKDPNDEDSPEIPVIDVTRCIGCGACEFECPARPFSAIYVEGHLVHKHN